MVMVTVHHTIRNPGKSLSLKLYAMTIASTEKLLKLELRDILSDLTDLNSLSLELQFNNQDVTQYRYWLKNAISYTLLARNAVGGKLEYRFDPGEVDSYCDLGDLAELTNSLFNRYKSLLLIYLREAGESLGTLLNIIGMCLNKLKEICALK